ncbi:G_PROTEIN_RECEP_F3_4 domain-containing protein [Durusdinium trenchii]|uniref:G_PROTEIN_RECEP_F3_4 domain-containing protein n=1 Tax=Durusdinium trenchii TaxID=1381693 RepID=A0ABP0Q7H0_9DINO
MLQLPHVDLELPPPSVEDVDGALAAGSGPKRRAGKKRQLAKSGRKSLRTESATGASSKVVASQQGLRKEVELRDWDGNKVERKPTFRLPVDGKSAPVASCAAMTTKMPDSSPLATLLASLPTNQHMTKPISAQKPKETKGFRIDAVVDDSPYARSSKELESAMTEFQRGWLAMSADEISVEALKRLSLHGQLEKKLRKEEEKVSLARVQVRAALHESCDQLVRSMLETIHTLKRRCSELQREKETHDARKNGLLFALETMTNDLGKHKDLNGSVAWSEISHHLFGTDHSSFEFQDALFRLQSAISQALALHSAAFNPSMELDSLGRVNKSRKEQLKVLSEQLHQRDQEVASIKSELSLGVHQRATVLDTSTTKAYLRATQQHQATIHRLQVEKDALKDACSSLARVGPGWRVFARMTSRVNAWDDAAEAPRQLSACLWPSLLPELRSRVATVYRASRRLGRQRRLRAACPLAKQYFGGQEYLWYYRRPRPWRMRARCSKSVALLTTLAAALLAAGQAQQRVRIGSFLNFETGTSNKEPYMLHAYRMGFIELMEGRKVSDMNHNELEAASKRYVVANAGPGELRLQGDVSLAGVDTRLVLDFMDTTGLTSYDDIMDSWLATVGSDPRFVLGGHSSTREKKRAAWANDNSVIFISGGGASGSIYSGDNQYAFGILSSIGMLANNTMDLLTRQIELGVLPDTPYKVALLYEDAQHGYDYRDAVNQVVAENPDKYQVAIEKAFPLDLYTTVAEFDNLTAEVREVVGSETDWLLLVDAHSSDFRLLHTNFAENDMNFQAITYGARGTDAGDLEAIVAFANGDEALQASFEQSLRKVFAGVWWSPGLKIQASLDFVTGWRKHETILWVEELDKISGDDDSGFLFRKPSDQLEPSWHGATGFEAWATLVAALNTTSDRSSSAVRDAIFTMDRPAILPGGRVAFKGQFQLQESFTMAQNQLVDENSLNVGAAVTLSDMYPLIVFPESTKTSDFWPYPSFGAFRPVCSAADRSIEVGKCTSDNTREITYVWKDKDGEPCPGGEGACYCENLGDHTNVEIECTFIANDSGIEVAVNALGIIATCISCIFVLLLLLSWNYDELRGAHKPFLLGLGLASVWCAGSIFSLTGPNNDSECTARIFNILLGVGLLLSLLLGMVVYWYRVWIEPTTTNLKMSSAQLCLPSGICFFICVVLAISWAAVVHPLSINRTVVTDGVSYEETVCNFGTDNTALVVITGLYYGLMLLFCVVLSYQCKEVDGKYFASWFLWVATFNVIFMVLILGILVGLVNLNTYKVYFVVAVVLFWCSIIVGFCAIFPRLSAVYGVQVFTPEANHGGTTGNLSTDSQNMVSKYINGRASKRTRTHTAEG